MKQTLAITKNHEFKKLYHRGKTSVSPYFALYLRPNRPFEPQDQNLLGITVGVKLGNAVVRNKVRRRIREIYRLEEDKLKKGHHVVIVARNRCATSSYKEMSDSLLKLFDQIQLSQNPKYPPRFQTASPQQGKKPKKKNTEQKKDKPQ